MKKTGGGDDQAKLELVAMKYMDSRETMWQYLARECGENWKDVEKMVRQITIDHGT